MLFASFLTFAYAATESCSDRVLNVGPSSSCLYCYATIDVPSGFEAVSCSDTPANTQYPSWRSGAERTSTFAVHPLDTDPTRVLVYRNDTGGWDNPDYTEWPSAPDCGEGHFVFDGDLARTPHDYPVAGTCQGWDQDLQVTCCLKSTSVPVDPHPVDGLTVGAYIAIIAGALICCCVCAATLYRNQQHRNGATPQGLLESACQEAKEGEIRVEDAHPDHVRTQHRNGATPQQPPTDTAFYSNMV